MGTWFVDMTDIAQVMLAMFDTLAQPRKIADHHDAFCLKRLHIFGQLLLFTGLALVVTGTIAFQGSKMLSLLSSPALYKSKTQIVLISHRLLNNSIVLNVFPTGGSVTFKE